MKKKIMAAITVATLAVTLLTPAEAFASTTTEVISTERTTTTDMGVAGVTSDETKTTTTISVIENGAVAKTVKYTYFANGDVSYENGATIYDYRTADGVTSIKVSTPVDNRSTLVTQVSGTSKSLGGGVTEVSVYDETTKVLAESHTTSPSGIKVVKYDSSGKAAETQTIGFSFAETNGIKFGTVTTVVEKPVSNSSGDNSGGNSGNSGSEASEGSGNSSGGSGAGSSTSESSENKLPKGYVVLSKVKRSTKLEKKTYSNELKTLDSLAKKNGWDRRGYKRTTSTKKKVVTSIYYAGKPKGGNSEYWTFSFKVIRSSSGKVTYRQNGKTVGEAGVKDLIKHPEKYY